MKAALTFFLALQLTLSALMPGRAFFELTKIPVLVKHYRHHCADHGYISFGDFLNLHYGNLAHQHDQEEHHEELPFKTTSVDSSSMFCLTSALAPRDPGSLQLISIVPAYPAPTIKVATWVWHPPRA